MGLVRRRTVLVRLAGQTTPLPKTGSALVPRLRRSGKWKPLGARNHVPSDPALLNIMRSLRDGKRTLIGLARHAAATDLRIARLIENWDALTPGAQKVVTLTDLCKFSDVIPARFIAGVARAGSETDNHSVALILSNMHVPTELEIAFNEELTRRDLCT